MRPSQNSITLGEYTDQVIREGTALIVHVESLLERSFDSHISWQDLHSSDTLRREELDLRNLFIAHRQYANKNIEQQLNLTASISQNDSQFVSAKVSILESQLRTIESLIKSCTDIVYIHRGEVSAMRSNLLAGIAIFIAVGAVLALKA